jgi:glyceraldehyde 3-phosphate dehydrogenase
MSDTKKIRVAINGFGRIGRQFFKAAQESNTIDVVAINDLGDLENLAYLLRYDTVYGAFTKTVLMENGSLVVDGKTITYVSEKDPSALPWGELGIDVVVESTGRFTSYEKAKAHLDAGAKRVVLSAPAKDDGETPTITPNVNVNAAALARITSNASCTTNAVVPLASILIGSVGIVHSVLNTIHAYTSTQSIVDGPGKDFRKGRAAAQNITPTSTGAAIAAAKAIPGMKDKFDGLAVRVPVPAGSIIDFTFVAERPTSVEEVNGILREAATKPEWQGIFAVTEEPLVSSDIIRNPHGSTADLALTRVVGGTLVKIMSWYDNEWGYVHMLRMHVESLAPLL